MGLSRSLAVCVLVVVIGLSSCQTRPSSQPSPSPSLSSSPSSSRGSLSAGGAPPGYDSTASHVTSGPNSATGSTPGEAPPQKQPLWLKCVSQATTGDFSSGNIAKVMEVWCQHYSQIINCLSRDLETSAPTNPLDFFISLTFDEGTLRSRSLNVCSKMEAMKDKLACAVSSNDTQTAGCARSFSAGLVHVFTLHKEQNTPSEILRNIACDITLQTTFCLRDTLPECEGDVQTALLNYYALFTNETCVAQADDEMRRPRPETIVAKCAKEAAQTLTPDQTEPEPTSLLDFLILGLKTDCKTFEARYTCYERELDNITNFRDFWLSLTFDHNNAVNSQKTYCEQLEERVIPSITDECFNKSQPGLAACETGFGREVETIREEWYNNPEFDGLQLQTVACRTSVTRAACLDKAMQPCGEEVSRAMAVSEMGILPDICRRLLAPDPTAQTGQPDNSGMIGGNTGFDGDSRASTEGQPSSDGSYRPGPKPTHPAYSEKPMSDQTPSGQGKDNSMHGHSGYDTETKKDTMSKTTGSSDNKMTSGKGATNKHSNGVSASDAKSQDNNDNGAGLAEGATVIVVLQMTLAVGVARFLCD